MTARCPRPELDFLFIHTAIDTPAFDIRLAPIGLIELSSWLSAHGFRCRFLDTRHLHFSLPWLQDYLASMRPRFIGFDVFTDTLFTVARLARIARAASPSSRIVLGGAHASAIGGELLRDVEADVVVRGEGEVPCLQLLTSPRLGDVKGIAYRRGRAIAETAPAALIDLDEKPSPDYRLAEPTLRMAYKPAISTGRGCPYRCTFCAAPGLSHKVRWRSPERVAADIETVLPFCEGRFFTITDDTFTVDPDRVRELCRHLKALGGGEDLFWYAEGRVDRLAPHLELLPILKDAGMQVLQVGIESGDERVLAAYKKQIRLNDARTLVEACARERILMHTGFIFGGPFESEETLDRTQALLEELIRIGRGTVQFSVPFLNPFPGTDIFRHPERYGLEILDPLLFSSLSFDNCVTRSEAMSREQILRRRWEMNTPLILLLKETILAQDEAFKEELRGMTERIGHFHISQKLLFPPPGESEGDHVAFTRLASKRFLNECRHFLPFTPGIARDAVPVRYPLFSVTEEGLYKLPQAVLPQTESEIFHYSSGKLSGADIAVVLDLSEEKLCEALQGLSDKDAVFFRTF